MLRASPTQTDPASVRIIRESIHRAHHPRRIVINIVGLAAAIAIHANLPIIAYLTSWLLASLVILILSSKLRIGRNLSRALGAIDPLMPLLVLFPEKVDFGQLSLLYIMSFAQIASLVSMFHVRTILVSAACVEILSLALIPFQSFSAEDVCLISCLIAIAATESILLSGSLGRGLLDVSVLARRQSSRREDAAKYHQSRADFLSNMSHELRTPLNGILGMSSLLVETDLDKDQREYCSAIRDSTELLISMINNILDMSRIEEGKLRLTDKPFDLRRTVLKVMENQAAAANDKNLSLEFSESGNVPHMVRGDSLRLSQILFNVVGNAIKFTPSGWVRIHLSSPSEHVAVGEVCQIVLSVEDSGVGIEESQLPRIFDRFMQADAETSRKFGGTGLGLSITKQLVSLFGGSITVRSRPGQGSRFEIELPFVLDESEEEGQPTQVKSVESRPIGEISLLIDDNAINLQLLDRMCKHLSLKAEAVASAIEGMSRAKVLAAEGRLSLAIVDYQMPDMTGTEIASDLRKFERENGLRSHPLIILTGRSSDEIRGETVSLGKCEILEKPIRLFELKNCMERLGLL